MASLAGIQAAFLDGDFRLTVHGLHELTADDLSVEDAVDAILSDEAEVIEDYPDDTRGACCLIGGTTRAAEPIHIVVRYPPTPAIITGYRLDPKKWIDLRTRRSI